ncbi:hypothetical protein AURDEDRAFT_164650 [Auricularia subglabra TFB-10046 SS5]|nr:hypothetical protein AURDEDRAFT_164650 [Auricularia subglabra TFB-10046 SS5]
MSLPPVHAEPASDAGTGPEDHERTPSCQSGLATDSTIVVAAAADMPAPDAGSDSVKSKGTTAATAPRVPKRAASVADLRVETTKRGRVTTETASGAPVPNHTTTNTTGSPTAATPITVSVFTATALAVADTTTRMLDGPNEVPNAGDHGCRTAAGAPAPGNGDAAGVAGITNRAAAVNPSSALADTASLVYGGAPSVIRAAAPAASHVHALVQRASNATSAAAPAIPAGASANAESTSGTPPTDTPTRRAFARVAKYAAAVASMRLTHIARIPDVSRPPATDQKYLPRKPRNVSRIRRAILCMRSSAVSHGVPDPDPHAEAQIEGDMFDIEFRVQGIISGAIQPTNGHPATGPLPSEEDDAKNPPPGNPELDADTDAFLLKWEDRPGVNDDGWNNEDPEFDPWQWLVKPGEEEEEEADEEYEEGDGEVYGDGEPYDEYELEYAD